MKPSLLTALLATLFIVVVLGSLVANPRRASAAVPLRPEQRGALIVAAQSTTATNQMTSTTGALDNAAPPLRERSLGENLLLVAIFGVISAIGLFLARTAREKTTAQSDSDTHG